MYIFVFADNEVRIAQENLTVADCLAVQQGLLRVIRVAPSSPPLLLSPSLVWGPIPEATSVPAQPLDSPSSGRLHLSS